MLLVVCVVLVTLTVPLAGGRLVRVGHVRFRASAALLAGLGIQVVIISVVPGLPRALATALHLLSYVLLTVFLVSNRAVPWLWMVGLGGALNFLAIAANGGVMPASPEALAAAGRATELGVFVNSAPVTDAHLRFLGDMFSLPRWVPLANVFSVGDALIVAGAFLLLHAVSGSRLSRPAHVVEGASRLP